MKSTILSAAVSAALLVAAGCDRGATDPAPEKPVEAPAPMVKAPHCFFKETETKDWKIAPGIGGALVVTGKAYRSDGRYKAVLLDPEISGTTAVVRPSIAPNDTGFSAVDDWWAVERTIPGAGLASVEVRCGDRLVATLPVKQGG